MRTLAGLLVVGSLTIAEAEDEVAGAIVIAITKNTGISELVPKLTDEALEALAVDAPDARDVCTAAAAFVYRAARARNDWEPLVERVVALGRMALDASPENADALHACAEAELCRLRLAVVLERVTKSDEWLAAAELFLKAHGVEPADGKLMERAASVLREGAGSPGIDGAPLHERADKVCEDGVQSYPESKFFREVLLDRRLAKIEAQLVTDRRGGQKALTDYLAELRPKAEAKTPDMVAATAYTNAVTVARAAKGLGVKADYVTRTLRVAGSNLLVDVPVSERWEYEGGVIRQYDRNGDHLRSFTFDTYSWSTNYYIGQTQFGGDNLKGLAQLDEINAEEMVVKITKRKKPDRRRLNGRFTSAVYFEVSGFDDEGDFLRWANYYVKTEKRISVQVSLLEFRDIKDADPETKCVIDSFREPD